MSSPGADRCRGDGGTLAETRLANGARTAASLCPVTPAAGSAAPGAAAQFAARGMNACSDLCAGPRPCTLHSASARRPRAVPPGRNGRPQHVVGERNPGRTADALPSFSPPPGKGGEGDAYHDVVLAVAVKVALRLAAPCAASFIADWAAPLLQNLVIFQVVLASMALQFLEEHCFLARRAHDLSTVIDTPSAHTATPSDSTRFQRQWPCRSAARWAAA